MVSVVLFNKFNVKRVPGVVKEDAVEDISDILAKDAGNYTERR